MMDVMFRDPISLAMSLSWKPAFECGHLLIDFQHRELFKLANDALRAVDTATEDELDGLIERLLSRIRRHFVDEEALLAQIAYPGLHDHLVEHRRILAEVESFRDRVRDGRRRAVELVELVCFGVVAAHMLDSDRAYFACLQGAMASGLVEP